MAERDQLAPHDAAQLGLVVDQQHQRPAGPGRCGLRVGCCTQRLAGGRTHDRRCVECRQQQRHLRAGAGAAVQQHAAAALVHEAVDHRQPQAAALAEALGGEEGLEDPRLRGLVHADAGVGDADAHMAAGQHLGLGRLGRVEQALVGLDAQLAALGHRVAGVDRQVQDRALELVRVGARDQAPVRRLQRGQQPHRVRQRAHQQLRGIGHHLADIDRARRQRLLAREGQQPADQVGAAVRGLQRRRQELGQLRIARMAVAQRGEVADHHRQHVVEIVRDAAGELADRLHLLRLRDGHLRLLDLADIDRQHEAAQHLAVGPELRDQLGAGVDDAAVVARHLVLVALAAALERQHHMRDHHRIDLGRQHVDDRPPGGDVAPAPEPVGVALVGVLVDMVAVEVADQRRHVVEDQAQPRLAQAQFGQQRLAWRGRGIGLGVRKDRVHRADSRQRADLGLVPRRPAGRAGAALTQTFDTFDPR